MHCNWGLKICLNDECWPPWDTSISATILPTDNSLIRHLSWPVTSISPKVVQGPWYSGTTAVDHTLPSSITPALLKGRCLLPALKFALMSTKSSFGLFNSKGGDKTIEQSVGIGIANRKSFGENTVREESVCSIWNLIGDVARRHGGYIGVDMTCRTEARCVCFRCVLLFCRRLVLVAPNGLKKIIADPVQADSEAADSGE